MSASFDYYRTFYYVAKYKNFTRAATMLLSSQPSVTRSIQNLESELGCRLFIRSRHGVTLTPEGEMLYRYVAPACERILRGEEELGLSLGLLPRRLHRCWDAPRRSLPRRHARRDRRIEEPPLVRRRAVPPRIQEPPQQAASPVPRLCRGLPRSRGPLTARPFYFYNTAGKMGKAMI